LIVSAVLGLVLAGFMQEFSSVIIVWSAGALMMLIASSEAFRSRISSRIAASFLILFLFLTLGSAVFGAYIAFAWTGQYYDAFLGLALAMFIFAGVLFLNGYEARRFSKGAQNSRLAGWVAVGAGFSYTLFLTHYSIIIFLNGLNLAVDRAVMLLAILLITNFTAFLIALFTEKRHRGLAMAIKKRFGMAQV
jgi:hypothetical protein